MKKFLSIISALVVALTLSISAFATQKPTIGEIEQALMAYKPTSKNDLRAAFKYYSIHTFLNSKYFLESNFTDIDVTNKYSVGRLDSYINEWSQNYDQYYPDNPFKILNELTDKTKINEEEQGIYHYENRKNKITYTIRKVNNQWVMKKDSSDEIIFTLPVVPDKYISEVRSKRKTDSSSSKTENKATTSSGNDEQAVARPDTSQVTADIAPEQKPETSSTNTEQPENSVNEQPVLKIDEPDKPTTNMTVNSPDSSSDVSDNSEQEEDENDSNIAPWIIIGTILAGAVVLGVIIIKKKK